MLCVIYNPPFMMKELERKHSHAGRVKKMCAFLLTKDAIERKMPKALKPQCIIQKYAQLLRV